MGVGGDEEGGWGVEDANDEDVDVDEGEDVSDGSWMVVEVVLRKKTRNESSGKEGSKAGEEVERTWSLISWKRTSGSKAAALTRLRVADPRLSRVTQRV